MFFLSGYGAGRLWFEGFQRPTELVGAGEDEDDEHGPASAVDDGEGREDDGEEDTKYGHKEIICLDYSAKISGYGLNVNNRLRL